MNQARSTCSLLLALHLLVAGCAPTSFRQASPPGPENPGGSGLHRPNVVLISVDGCRADRLGAWGNARPASPHMDRIAQEGVAFLRNTSQANESLPSHASLLTSRYPSEMGPLDYNQMRIPDSIPTLASILKAQGYATGAFTGGGHVHHSFGFDQGFDVYSDYTRFERFSASEPAAMRWIDTQRDHPKFVFLHGYDCHRPYVAPTIFSHVFGAEYKGDVDSILDARTLDRTFNNHYYPDFQIVSTWMNNGLSAIDPTNYPRLIQECASNKHQRSKTLTPEDIAHIRDHYDGSVAYADSWLGVFFAQLSQRGLDRSNTLVIILADHGEDLMEHGFFNHRTGLQPVIVHVPLIFWGAGVDARCQGSRHSMVTENLDVVPTVLSLLHLQAPQPLRGMDLSPLLRTPEGQLAENNRVGYSAGFLGESSITDDQRHLVCKGAASGSQQMLDLLESPGTPLSHFELYDVRPGADRTMNLAQDPDKANDLSRLRRLLATKERLAQMPSTWQAPRPLEPGLRRSLQENGYW